MGQSCEIAWLRHQRKEFRRFREMVWIDGVRFGEKQGGRNHMDRYMLAFDYISSSLHICTSAVICYQNHHHVVSTRVTARI